MEQANQSQSDFWNGETAKAWIALDDIQGRSFEGVSRTLVDAAGIETGQMVLDVGCGTGDTALPIARLTRAPVTGVDISKVMLERAQQRLAAEPDLDARFMLGDAQTHGFAKGVFDRVVSRFGMMFFADPVAAFRNIARGLKPGGEMHFICWGNPKMNPWFGMPRQIAVRHFGELAPATPRSPGPFGFADQEWVLGLMKDAGLAEARVKNVDIGLTPGKTIQSVLPLASLGPISSAMREKDGSEQDQQELVARFQEALAQFETPDGIVIPSHLNQFSARK